MAWVAELLALEMVMNAQYLKIIALVGLVAACGSSSESSTQRPSPVVQQSPYQPTTPVYSQNSVTNASVSGASPITIPENLIPNFHQVDANVFRSGHPTVTGVSALSALGIKTILSLETDGNLDEKAAADAANIRYINVPMNGILRPTMAQINEALRIVSTPANQPILVHCQFGKDRTGLVIAAYHIRTDRWDVERATKDMYNFGHSQYLSWWDPILAQLQ